MCRYRANSGYPIPPGLQRAFSPEQCVDAAFRKHYRIASSYRRAVDTYRIYDGTDENGIVGTVAPELFAQEGRCWRVIYENPVGHGTQHGQQLVPNASIGFPLIGECLVHRVYGYEIVFTDTSSILRSRRSPNRLCNRAWSVTEPFK
jgi:hypothetical protein